MYRVVPIVELLDDQVDLTPARHLEPVLEDPVEHVREVVLAVDLSGSLDPWIAHRRPRGTADQVLVAEVDAEALVEIRDQLGQRNLLGLVLPPAAMRYAADHAVGRPDIQAFVGALHGQQADRGVFITTSRFSAEARSNVERIPNRIVLIDGRRLAELMILHNVGVQDESTFVLKRLDEDFFEQ